LAFCSSKAQALIFIKPKEQSNDGQLASVLRLFPRSVILSSQEGGKMAVIQYEKASTHSSDNKYLLSRQ
jgi:hypothetical protein